MAKNAKPVQPAQAEAPAVVTLGAARAANFAQAPNPSALERAALVKPAKGTNPKKARVYGYDNGAGNGAVPKTAAVHAVPAMTGAPKGVTPAQWELLQSFFGQSVQVAYDGGVDSRSVRRAYRAGFIRFVA
jgi:hypothetical protein